MGGSVTYNNRGSPNRKTLKAAGELAKRDENET